MHHLLSFKLLENRHRLSCIAVIVLLVLLLCLISFHHEVKYISHMTSSVSVFLFLESSFMVSASSRTPSVTFGESFDLLCLVKPRHNLRVPTSVTWRFMPARKEADSNGQGEFNDLVTFTREGTLQWGEQLLGLGTRTTVDRSHSNTNFRLLVTRAGRREAGKYQCTAVLWRRNYDNTWSRVANRTSNLLGISVLQPGKPSRLLVRQTRTYLEWTGTSTLTGINTNSDTNQVNLLGGFLPALIVPSLWCSH